MKNQIGKILLIAIPIITAIFLLYPTCIASQLEQKKSEVEALAKKDKSSEDSLSRLERSEKEYGKDLENAKGNRLKLGLDLRVGMYVTMEVDVVRLIDEYAEIESKDELFDQLIEITRQESQKNDDPVIDIFLRIFEKYARPKGKSLLSYFDDSDSRYLTEEKIIKNLKENETNSIEQSIEVIRERIDKYGVAEPTIQKPGNRRIVLELPGVTKVEEMRILLQTTASLGFHRVRNYQNIVRAFYKIDKLLAEQNKRRKNRGEVLPGDTVKTDSVTTANPYAGLSEEETQKRYLEDHPFTTLFETYFTTSDERGETTPINYSADVFPDYGEYSFMIYEEAEKKFNEILRRNEVRSLLPFDIKILREAKPNSRILKENQVNAYNFFALEAYPELTGDYVANAMATFDPITNQPMVVISMNSDGSETWARITGANLKKRIAIVLDDHVYSAPVVQSKITEGSSSITGMGNAEEAHLLEILLNTGYLRVSVQIIEVRVVGP